ncbi:MAG: hypothetical protein ACQES5_08435 [Thermodesulfobacteriota bacterium]
MKNNTLSRRDFLTAGLKQAKQALHQRADQIRSQKKPENKETGFAPDISSDMTPELLAFEAERMGLDPEDRDGVLKAMQQSMSSK